MADQQMHVLEGGVWKALFSSEAAAKRRYWGKGFKYLFWVCELTITHV